MLLEGHVENGNIILDDPTPLPDGAKVWVEVVGKKTATTAAEDPGCFAAVGAKPPFDPSELAAMRSKLTPEQYEAILSIATGGGPNIEAINRIRSASLI